VTPEGFIPRWRFHLSVRRLDRAKSCRSFV
jgi:hypothetical protein